MFVAPPLPLVFADQKGKVSSAVSSFHGTLALTSGMKRGEEEAFEEFYRAYSRRLIAYLFVVTRGDEALAAELLQQTIIKVARSIRIFNEEEAFWNWLAMIARHCARDDARKDRRHSALLQRFWERPVPANQEPEPERVMEQVVESLAADERALLQKKYLEGLSVKDLARELGATEKAVESKLSRVRQKIKDLISTAK